MAETKKSLANTKTSVQKLQGDIRALTREKQKIEGELKKSEEKRGQLTSTINGMIVG
jgi:septal ring factor EnvC (AmiA/AmiB activator)